MIVLLLPAEQKARMAEALIEVGKREVGGVLMGQHVGSNTFRIVDLTCQRKGGTFASFIRRIEDILQPLREFFTRTRYDYTRFNYLGEWHSHHSFALSPSPKDHKSMMEIVNDSNVGARFAVLLLVRLTSGELECSVTLYQSMRAPRLGSVKVED